MSSLKDRLADKEDIRRYVCGYCGYVFDQRVNTEGTEKHNKITTQIQCRRCGNFLKSYE